MQDTRHYVFALHISVFLLFYWWQMGRGGHQTLSKIPNLSKSWISLHIFKEVVWYLCIRPMVCRKTSSLYCG